MKILLPAKVNMIIETFQIHGYEAYAVGGCVRDSILGRTPEDWDITTSAMPERTKALFRRTFDTGIDHGTVTVVIEREGFEVTTYRIDGPYEDSRHPKEVQYTRSLQEDLLRRDFTINAMAYNEESGLVDIFGGMKDLQDKIIRCVGNPRERFGEDALRILRALRFAAQLGFEIEVDTRKAIQELAPTLGNISVERIQVELTKMLLAPKLEIVKLTYQLGVLEVFLPEIRVEAEQIEELKSVRANKILRYVRLFYRQGEAKTKAILRRLKYDNDTVYKVSKLIEMYDQEIQPKAVCVRKAMNQMGVELFAYHLELHPDAQVELLYKQVIEQRQCVSLKELAVTGNDLIQAGMPRGKVIGDTLEMLLQEVMEHPERNKKELLLHKII
ncbi:MAG: CCA tRNA nucleotidyltransferase [Lachnospiraceae bacterium]